VKANGSSKTSNGQAPARRQVVLQKGMTVLRTVGTLILRLLRWIKAKAPKWWATSKRLLNKRVPVFVIVLAVVVAVVITHILDTGWTSWFDQPVLAVQNGAAGAGSSLPLPGSTASAGGSGAAVSSQNGSGANTSAIQYPYVGQVSTKGTHVDCANNVIPVDQMPAIDQGFLARYGNTLYPQLMDIPTDLLLNFLKQVEAVSKTYQVPREDILAVIEAEQHDHGFKPIEICVSKSGAVLAGQMTPGEWNGWNLNYAQLGYFLSDINEINLRGGCGNNFDGAATPNAYSMADNLAAIACDLKSSGDTKAVPPQQHLQALRDALRIYYAGCCTYKSDTEAYIDYGLRWEGLMPFPDAAQTKAESNELAQAEAIMHAYGGD
jgi:hypothetical protein